MMNMRNPSAPRAQELDIGDFTQEIVAPLEDYLGREEPTLTKIDFEDLEIKLEI